MDAKIFFITLAVDDLDRSLAVYRDGLGWPTEGIVGQEFHDGVTGADATIAIFILLRCMSAPTWPKTPACPAGRQFHRVQPGHPRRVPRGGRPAARPSPGRCGTLTAPAHMRPFGVCSGYLSDADGHLFEIAWNPANKAAG